MTSINIFQVRVPADVLLSKKGFGKEVVFTLPPTASIYTLIGEIEKVCLDVFQPNGESVWFCFLY